MVNTRVREQCRIPTCVRDFPKLLQGFEINPKLAVINLLRSGKVVLKNAL
jgi:hypothetical protein